MVMETVPFLRVCLCVCVLSFIYLFGHCDAVKQQAATQTKRNTDERNERNGRFAPKPGYFSRYLYCSLSFCSVKRENRERRCGGGKSQHSPIVDTTRVHLD